MEKAGCVECDTEMREAAAKELPRDRGNAMPYCCSAKGDSGSIDRCPFGCVCVRTYGDDRDCEAGVEVPDRADFDATSEETGAGGELVSPFEAEYHGRMEAASVGRLRAEDKADVLESEARDGDLRALPPPLLPNRLDR